MSLLDWLNLEWPNIDTENEPKSIDSVCMIPQDCDGMGFFNPKIRCYAKSILLNAVTTGFEYKCLDMLANLLCC